MTPTVAVAHDDFLIVVEGPARLTWCRTGSARWRPTGLWPTPAQQADVCDRIRRGSPLLVVLDEPTAIPLLAEEIADAPPELAALAEFAGDVGELRIPFLGWLPPDLAERGRRFLRCGRPSRPDVLVPPLVVDAPDPDVPHVRFARWSRRVPNPTEALVAAATHLFS
ncbi:hypothetical protein GCM10022243_00470 [Saccharothrix violaceirubra]|uniref:Uncharacterized protein n=1 Tax=Saccharothrix violaceirubra TaxID=413306 RepID=A0A7W7T2P6_9PSEU|nr:hypothetical protein [Saccharothrix violaceirubra]MBB4965459.1 hypothetical protein [Saccharothrix violaceirubra]